MNDEKKIRPFTMLLIGVMLCTSFFSCDLLFPTVYSVIYDANGATSGSVPTDSNAYRNGATVTILANIGNLDRDDYIFAGWNTKADGTGTTYQPGDTFTMGSAHITLYAQWLEAMETVAAGFFHTMMLKSDGTLWATGYNFYGQLGDGSTSNRYSPVQIMSNVKAVAAGDWHTMILKRDGTLWATGYNGYGQLGDGGTTTHYSPVQIMSDVKAVAAGNWHTMMLKRDGTLWATGYNEYGQLGDGSTATRSTPAQIMSDVKAVAAGYLHTMILKSDGTLWATGSNYWGQLGDGSTTNHSTPVQIM
ncbi:MAG: InlB B-repeat-containing protein, partial [Rectinema sp.]|nr:InlB B-repeat-containing protein [Rectinema sp.]